MPSELYSFLNAVPAAATNTYSLVAYLALLAAWLTVALRVKRHRILLAHIQHLPPRDRLAALRAEMGLASIPNDLSPEQFLRARVQSFLLIAYLTTAAVAVVVFVVAYAESGHLTGIVQ